VFQDDPAESDQDGGAGSRKAAMQPHDGFFRKVLSRPEDARSAVRALFPPELVARMDLDRLEVMPGSFVDEELRQQHTDVLLSTPIDGDDTFLYLVMEHQSTPDLMMAWRMLCYLVGVIRRYLDERPDATQLPVVLPVVVHQGKQPWSGPVDVREMISIKPETAELVEEHLLRLRFRLEDIGRFDPATLQTVLRTRPFTPLAKTMLLLMRTARRNPRMDEELEDWLDVLDEVRRAPDGQEMFLVVFAYLIRVSDTPIDKLRRVIARLGPEVEEDFMTTAEMLRAEGRVEGEAKGRAEGRAETLTQLLTQKFGPLLDSAVAKLRTASIEQLEGWTGRVLSATTLDEVFA
jgi:hypothetical protein